MKWIIDDEGNALSVLITEVQPRPGRTWKHPVCTVHVSTKAFEVPTGPEREEMLATAREIVQSHNAKENA